MSDFEKMGKRFDDVDDLPDAIKKELKITRTDDLDNKIIDVIDDVYGGMANIDEIIVGLYRKHNVPIDNRQFLSNKLYRIMQNKLIHSVSNKKGAYTTRKDLINYFQKN